MNDSDETMCGSPDGESYSQSCSPSILGGLHMHAKPTLKDHKEDPTTASSNALVQEELASLNLKREHQGKFSNAADGCDEVSTSPEYPPICSKIQKTKQNLFERSYIVKGDCSESFSSTQDFDSQILSNNTPTADCEEFGVLEECITDIEEQITTLMILREQGTPVSNTKEFTQLKQKMLDARILLSKINTVHQKQREELTQNSDDHRTSKQDLFVLASKQRRLLGFFKRYEELLIKAKSLKNNLRSKHMKILLPSLQGLGGLKAGSLSEQTSKEQNDEVPDVEGKEGKEKLVRQVVEKTPIVAASANSTAIKTREVETTKVISVDTASTKPATVLEPGPRIGAIGFTDTVPHVTLPNTLTKVSSHVGTAVRKETASKAVQQEAGHVVTAVRQGTTQTAVQQGAGHVVTAVRQDTAQTAVQQGAGHVVTAVRQVTAHTAVRGSGHVTTAERQDTALTTVQQGAGHVITAARQDTPRKAVQQGSVHVTTAGRQDTARTTVQQGAVTAVRQGTTRIAVQRGSVHMTTAEMQSTARTTVQQGAGHVTTAERQDTARTVGQQGAGHVTTAKRQDTARTAGQQGLVPVAITPATVQGSLISSLLPNCRLVYVVNTANTIPTSTTNGAKAVFGTKESAKKPGTKTVNLKATSLQQGQPKEKLVEQPSASSQAQSTRTSTRKQSNPDPSSSYTSLSNILSNNCTVRVIADDELIPTASFLPADFWSTSFDMIDLDPKLFAF